MAVFRRFGDYDSWIELQADCDLSELSRGRCVFSLQPTHDRAEEWRKAIRRHARRRNITDYHTGALKLAKVVDGCEFLTYASHNGEEGDDSATHVVFRLVEALGL